MAAHTRFARGFGEDVEVCEAVAAVADLVECFAGGVEVEGLARPRRGDVARACGRELVVDVVQAVDGEALAGPRVLDVAEADVGLVELLAGPSRAAPVAEHHVGPAVGDVEDAGGRAVLDAPELAVPGARADEDLVARPQLVRPPGERDRFVAQLAGEPADGLRAGVELVDAVVGAGVEDGRVAVGAAVGVPGLQGALLGVGLLVGDRDAVAIGPALDGVAVTAAAKENLVATVGGVAGADDRRQLDAASRLLGEVAQALPQPAGAHRLALLSVADFGQSGAAVAHRLQKEALFMGGRQCGLVVDDGRRGRQLELAVGDPSP